MAGGLKYTIPKKGANVLIRREVSKALQGSGISKATKDTANRARNIYTRKGPRHLRGAVTVSGETKYNMRIGVVSVTDPSALATEFGSRRNGGRGTHTMKRVAEEMTR